MTNRSHSWQPIPRGKRALLAIVLFGAALLGNMPASHGDPATTNCETDAMLVFDASGSMAGMGFGESTVTRIEQVRRALSRILPEVAPVRHLGLVTFGPGTRQACENVHLRLRPGPNPASRLLAEIDSLQPYGQTPISKSIDEAAAALDFRHRPAVVVLLTDGEETCGGNLCALAQQLKTEGAGVTVHVIGYMLSLANVPMGGEFVRCLSEATGGMFISAETTEELTEALRKTLQCPVISSPTGPTLAAKD